MHRSLAAPPRHKHTQHHGRGSRGGKDGEQVFHGRFKQEVRGGWRGAGCCTAELLQTRRCCLRRRLWMAPAASPRRRRCRLVRVPAPLAHTRHTPSRCFWQGERVWTAMRYDLRGSTEVRSRLRLRSTVPGANNRLDIQVCRATGCL